MKSLEVSTTCRWYCSKCNQLNLIVVYFPDANALQAALDQPYPLQCVVCRTAIGLGQSEALETFDVPALNLNVTGDFWRVGIKSHVFQGPIDRWCEICDLPDRHPIYETTR